jgi:hypothetical protein
MYIIMQMLGPDLGIIRKRAKDARLGIPTVLQVGLQGLEAIQLVHKHGYLHR